MFISLQERSGKAKTMVPKTGKKNEKKEIEAVVIRAAMNLAAEKGWNAVSLREIAGEAGIPIAALYSVFEDKTDILTTLGRKIDREVLENAAEAADDGDNPRERLFDLLMDRYEALNAYRGGICAILESFRCDPKQAVIALPHLCRSMNWMLEAAGIETGGLRGAAKVAGLTGLYLKILRVWKEDESRDLSRTMAALDKALGRAERMAESLRF